MIFQCVAAQLLFHHVLPLVFHRAGARLAIASWRAADRCTRPRTLPPSCRSICTRSDADGWSCRCRPDRIHLHGEADLADQVARMGADDAAAERKGLASSNSSLVNPRRARWRSRGRCRPGKHRLAVLDALRLALLLGDARPRDLRIGIGDRRDLARLEHAVLAGCGLRRDMGPCTPCAPASVGRRCRRWRRCGMLVRICLSTGM